jgi:hypothetical protein
MAVRSTYIRYIGLIVLLGACLAVAVPASACGCGAYIPREGDAHVTQERALVRWDGTTEDIVMALSVEGSSREAAWILPVPTEADVSLADARLFDALQEFTKPEVRVERIRMEDGATGGAPPGSPPVTLLERQQLGPFDVSTLAATDANALSEWLATNGYRFPELMADALTPYVEEGWVYVAVRLTPGEGTDLTGTLDPLRVTFPSDRIVYPMRLSALAHSSLPVFLYVLAEHRVEPPPVDLVATGPEVQFAGWVEQAALPPDSPIAPFVPRRMFLTKFYALIHDPASIKDDWTFGFAPTDEAFRDVVVEYEFVQGPTPAAIALMVSGMVVVGALVIVLAARQGTRRARA